MKLNIDEFLKLDLDLKCTLLEQVLIDDYYNCEGIIRGVMNEMVKFFH